MSAPLRGVFGILGVKDTAAELDMCEANMETLLSYLQVGGQ